MRRFMLVLAISFLFLSSAAWSQSDTQLVGSWMMNGMPLFTFNEDGSGTLTEDRFRWRTEGGMLILEHSDGVETLPYRISNGQLQLQMSGSIMTLTRGNGGQNNWGGDQGFSGNDNSADQNNPPPGFGMEGQAPGGAEFGNRAGNGAGNAGASDQLSQLLLSSAWCSFSYNQTSGRSSTSRVQMFNNGSWQMTSGSESYNSGINGTFASQNSAVDGGQWQVGNGQLWLSTQASPQLNPVDLQISRNNNGSIVLRADGTEYVPCQ